MTAKLVSLGDEKEKRRGRCEYCGHEAHAESLMCPRIVSVIYHQGEDGTEAVEVVFRSTWEPPLAG